MLRLSSNIDATALSAREIFFNSHSLVLQCFGCSRSDVSRCIYAVSGYLFYQKSPFPFGAPSSNPSSRPGYLDFEGDNPLDLLAFLISSAYTTYWSLQGRGGLDAIVEAVNHVLKMDKLNEKDVLDELVLRGMSKAGLFDLFARSTTLLVPLRDSRKEPGEACVTFSTRRESLEE
ncbi:hypothetical protein HK100_012246 [Physocladia obscura]|uniref:Uncharacterized protein n=1 Tax=Physocladia obscura TaxID=109957 RepID=A0AAD5T0Z1_9FUNG|nr:hypothetical protein HK100_012246 [Physocladia obscura]